MPSSGIINLAIGMALVFGVTAALSSVITEAIARYLGLRGSYLLRGLSELLDGSEVTTDLTKAVASFHALKVFINRRQAPTSARAAATAEPANQRLQDAAPAAEHPQVPRSHLADRSPVEAATAVSAVPSATSALFGSPILRSQGMFGQISSRTLKLTPPSRLGRLPKLAASSAPRTWRECRSLPSYIPARSFAVSVVDLVVPDGSGQTTMATVMQGVNALPDAMTVFKPSLQALAKNAGGNIGVFRISVGRWYDDHMHHVSREYKRRVARITLVVGAVIVLLFNINTLTIGRSLYSNSADSAVSTAVAAKGTVWPIGWTTVRDCNQARMACNWLDQRGIFSRHGGSGWQAVLFLIGFLLTIVALVPGARFWFVLVTRLRDTLGL
jgi:hypothetical protein